MDRKSLPSHILTNVMLLVFYGIIAWAFFYPQLSEISVGMIGPPGDNMNTYWGMWWFEKSLTDPQTHLNFTPLVHFPEGADLTYYSYSFYNLILSFLLSPFLSKVTIYNLLMAHTFVLAGAGAYWLAREFSGGRLLSLAAGFIYAFNPSHYIHALCHLNIGSVQFIPFFALFVIRYARTRSGVHLALASVFFLLNSLCDWNYMVMCAFFLMFAYAYLLIKNRTWLLKSHLAGFFAIAFFGTLPLLPWIIPMIRTGLDPNMGTYPGHGRFVADLANFITPPPFHYLAPAATAAPITSKLVTFIVEEVVYLGIANLILFAFALCRLGKRMSKIILGFSAFAVLSLGTDILVRGNPFPFPLPYDIIQHIPILSQARCPSRFVVFVYLFLGIGVVLGLKPLLGHPGRRRAGRALVGAALVLIFLDFHTVSRVRTIPVDLPVFDIIKKNLKPGEAILQVPIVNHIPNQFYMMQQAQHQIPMVNGVIGRQTEHKFFNDLTEVIKNPGRMRRELKSRGIKYIVIHKHLLHSYAQNAVETYAEHFLLIYEDYASALLAAY